MLKKSRLIFIILGMWLLFPRITSGANIVNTAWVFYSGGTESDTCTIVPLSVCSIKGKVKDSDGKGVSYVNVTLSGDKSDTYQTKEDGGYEFSDLVEGNYTITPISAYMNFEPSDRNYLPLTQDWENQDFTAKSVVLVPINNLFNPAKGEHTTIIYKLDKRCRVIIKLYDLLGELIITLVDEDKDAGSYSIDWFGKNENGSTVASGTYLLYFKAGDYKKTEKIIIIK